MKFSAATMRKERTNVDAKTLAVKSDFGCIIAGISDM